MLDSRVLEKMRKQESSEQMIREDRETTWQAENREAKESKRKQMTEEKHVTIQLQKHLTGREELQSPTTDLEWWCPICQGSNSHLIFYTMNSIHTSFELKEWFKGVFLKSLHF